MTSTKPLHLLLAIIVTVMADLEMRFLKYPESVPAPVGDEVNFECEVNVPGEGLAWRWRPADDPNSKWVNVPKANVSRSTETTSTLIIKVREDTIASFYQCVVSYGSIVLVSVPARLSIARIDTSHNTPERRVISAPPYNTIVLHCREPISDPPTELTWWKESKRIKTHIETSQGILVITNSTVEDSGTYTCKATNEINNQAVDLPESTILKIQPDGREVRFIEEEFYVGKIDADGTLTAPVKLNGALRLWCGAVGTPPPTITWHRQGRVPMETRHGNLLIISPFTENDEGVYSCIANGLRRSWKVVPLQPPRWEGSTRNLNASEGGEARVSCGTLHGQPPPDVQWVLNGQTLKTGKGIRVTSTHLQIDKVEKRHAGIVQCFACNTLGCTYEAALLHVVPTQIPDQEYSAEMPRTLEFASLPPKRHNKKNSRKNKAVMIPPSRPNVTRLDDNSVMVFWTHENQGLTIQFFKVQYKEASNSSNIQWNTGILDLPSYIHSCEIDSLASDKYYKFRIAAVYSNQDNKQGKSSARFYLAKGSFPRPKMPEITRAASTSLHSIQLEWTWSSGRENVHAEGFYVYARPVSSAGLYEIHVAAAHARSLLLSHLTPDTAYELKLRAFTAHTTSDFSGIMTARTARAAGSATTTEATRAGSGTNPATKPDPLITAGGALGATILLAMLALTFLLCRRARRPSTDKEKGSVPETGGANGYIPAKVPITITANPMHSESTDGGVEMSFLHNNNTGNNDDTLPRSIKNGPTPARQYV